MPIANRSCSQHAASEMTKEEFMKWLDADREGGISVEELRQAIRATGGWFSTRKAKHGVKTVDKSLNGVVDDYEMNNLIDFAQKNLGVRMNYTCDGFVDIEFK